MIAPGGVCPPNCDPGSRQFGTPTIVQPGVVQAKVLTNVDPGTTRLMKRRVSPMRPFFWEEYDGLVAVGGSC